MRYVSSHVTAASTNCKHPAFPMVSLWECDIIHIPSLSISVSQPLSPTERGFIHLVRITTAHVSHSWIICAIASFDLKPIYTLHLFPDNLQYHRPTDRNTSPLHCQSISTLLTSIPAAQSTYWLFWHGCLVRGRLRDLPIQLRSLPGQQHLSSGQQPIYICLCADSCSAFIAIGNLPPLRSPCRGRALVTYLLQQCLKPAGWHSLL